MKCVDLIKIICVMKIILHAIRVSGTRCWGCILYFDTWGLFTQNTSLEKMLWEEDHLGIHQSRTFIFFRHCLRENFNCRQQMDDKHIMIFVKKLWIIWVIVTEIHCMDICVFPSQYALISHIFSPFTFFLKKLESSFLIFLSIIYNTIDLIFQYF